MRLQLNFKSMSFSFLIPLILSIGLLSSISFFDLIQEAEGSKSTGISPMIDIKTTGSKAGETISIEVEFGDPQGKNYQDVNYNIKVTQEGTVILDEQGVYDQDGQNNHQTMPLPSPTSEAVPATVNVYFLGFGTNEPFTQGTTFDTGRIGEFEKTVVVPEFGTIAVMILGISIISIIAVTSRSKVIPRL